MRKTLEKRGEIRWGGGKGIYTGHVTHVLKYSYDVVSTLTKKYQVKVKDISIAQNRYLPFSKKLVIFHPRTK